MATHPSADGCSSRQELDNVAKDVIVPMMDLITALPRETSEDGLFFCLPAPQIQLPRALPPPPPVADTKWAQYAKSRGIKKTKRDEKVWDEELGKWLPRHGLRRKVEESKKGDSWLVELKPSYEMSKDKDPFLDARSSKRERVKKQQVAQRRNARTAVAASDLSARIVTSSAGKFDVGPTAAVSKQSKKRVTVATKKGGKGGKGGGKSGGKGKAKRR
eukprot:TRINITY_DN34822_c0_g1_i1.p2 TRINITY_DN34822_c0_g1~~TRINITY_DN34822_c0_g1_i1.p2  ORF type:complete len:253 (-),score=40.85 TRINITY_DN34822_c0_g1_i1:87-737(-)